MADNIIYLNPAPGLETNLFETNIMVRIIASSGSYIEVDFQAQVCFT